VNSLIKSILLSVLLAGAASAQMSHRIAVLVNENSQASKKAANWFSAYHGVSGGNLIYLNVPESIVTGRAECTPAEFTAHIWEPANEVIKARGLEKQIQAWVYSVDFPIRILNSGNDRQQMSITGLTFTRNHVPAPEVIEKAQYGSPLFAGPAQPGGGKNPPASFDSRQSGLKDRMPLPAMMLGYIGEKGTDIETVIRCIETGAKAKSKPVAGKIFLVKTADEKRSGPREWQFGDAQIELGVRGISAAVVTNIPSGETGILGVMIGAADVKPSSMGTFAPGAIAEHFSSWSAEFQKRQSKCTEWLKAGATATAGMVTEPYNAWPKFPHARLYVHYASGCTAMESFYQALLCPLQVLPLGDPLAQIRGIPMQIKTIGLSAEISSDLDSAFVAQAQVPGARMPILYTALLDGKQIKNPDGTTLIELPFAEMGDGYHEVRIVAQIKAPVALGGVLNKSFTVNKKGRSLEITGVADRDPQQIVFTVEAKGEEKPEEIYLLWNGRRIACAAYGAELAFDERTLGEGPHRVQAVAGYADGMTARSAPKPFAIIFSAAGEPEDTPE